jgi:hypothetical protein
MNCQNFVEYTTTRTRVGQILPQIQEWLNKTVASFTGYAPVELIFNAQNPDILAKFLPELGDPPEREELATEVLKAYTKMKQKASKMDKRRKLGNSKWTPKVNDKVLVKKTMSDAINVISREPKAGSCVDRAEVLL